MQGTELADKKSNLMKLIDIVSNLRKKDSERDAQFQNLNDSFSIVSSKICDLGTTVDGIKKAITLKPYHKTYDLLDKARKDLKDAEINLVSKQLLRATEESLADKINHNAKNHKSEI